MSLVHSLTSLATTSLHLLSVYVHLIHLPLLSLSHSSICPFLIVIIPPSSQPLTCLCLHKHTPLHLISTLNYHLHYHPYCIPQHSLRYSNHFQLVCRLFVDTARHLTRSLLHPQPPNVARPALLILILPTTIEFHSLLSISNCTTSSPSRRLDIRLDPQSTTCSATSSSLA